MPQQKASSLNYWSISALIKVHLYIMSCKNIMGNNVWSLFIRTVVETNKIFIDAVKVYCNCNKALPVLRLRLPKNQGQEPRRWAGRWLDDQNLLAIHQGLTHPSLPWSQHSILWPRNLAQGQDWRQGHPWICQGHQGLQSGHQVRHHHPWWG